MAVRVPRIQRDQVAQTPSVGRIQASVPDASRAQAAIGGAIEDVGQQLVQVEENAANIKAAQVGLELERWANERINGKDGLAHLQGDPTPAYAQFYEELKQRYEDASDQGFSPLVKSRIQKVLAGKYNSIYNQATLKEGQQFDTYDERVTTGAVNNAKQRAASDGAYVQVDDPATLAPFEATLQEIDDLHIKRSKRVGTAQVAEDGQYLYINDDGEEERINLGPAVQYQIAKDRGEATYNAINNLLRARQVDKAQFMMDRYSQNLDPVNKAKLNEAFERIGVEEKAYNEVNEMYNLTFEQKKQAIGRIKDVKVRKKAGEILDAQDRYRQNLRTRSSKEAYNQIYDIIEANRKTKQPWSSWFEAQQDPTISGLLPRVTNPTFKKALKKQIEGAGGGAGDSAKFGQLLTRAQNGEFYQMPGSDFEAMTTGLNKTQYNKIFSIYRQQNFESDSQERTRVRHLMKQVEFEAERAGLIRRGRFGDYTKKSRERLNELKGQAIDASTTGVIKGSTTPEINERAKQIVIEEKKRIEREQGGGFFGGLMDALGFGGDDVQEGASPESDFYKLPAAEQFKWYQKFGQENDGKEPQTDQEIIDFYEERRLDGTE